MFLSTYKNNKWFVIQAIDEGNKCRTSPPYFCKNRKQIYANCIKILLLCSCSIHRCSSHEIQTKAGRKRNLKTSIGRTSGCWMYFNHRITCLKQSGRTGGSDRLITGTALTFWVLPADNPSLFFQQLFNVSLLATLILKPHGGIRQPLRLFIKRQNIAILFTKTDDFLHNRYCRK